MKYLFTLVLFLCSLSAYSQNKTIDSLKEVLQTQKEDTAKAHTLFALVHEYKYTNSDTALYFENAALTLATKLNYRLGIARAKRGLSAICADEGKYDEGVRYGNEALNLYKELLSYATAANKEMILKGLALTYTLIGHNTFSQGSYPEALRNTFLALDISEKLGDKGGISLNQFNIGNIYLGQHNYSQALKYLHSALKIAEQLGDKGFSAYIINYIGLLYFEQGNHVEALKNYSIALKIAKEINDIHTLQEVYNSLGRLADKQENYIEALKYDFAALRLYKETSFNEEIPHIYNNIASVYIKQKKYNEASPYLDTALSFAKKIGSLLYIRLSYENLAGLDSIRGNYKNAFEHYKLATLYDDSLFNQENTRKLVQQQMQYDFDKKQDSTTAVQDKKNALAAAEIKNQKLIRNFSVGGAFAVLSFGGYSFYRYRRRRKLQSQQEMLNERLRISRELHDDVGATLSGIAMYSHLAKEQLKTNQNLETERSLNVVHQSAGEMVNKLSDIVWLINPDHGSLRNLADRLEEYAINMASVKNMQVKVHAPGKIAEIDLPMEARRNIYLICKEGINNAVKYSEGTLLVLSIKELDNKLMFTISDNGKGFDAPPQNVKANGETLGRNGLKNMRARADDIKASLDIQSEINMGTNIQLVVIV